MTYHKTAFIGDYADAYNAAIALDNHEEQQEKRIAALETAVERLNQLVIDHRQAHERAAKDHRQTHEREAKR